ncbi:MAG: MAPEG family protein [Gammaproteobacteria bacterium]|nr:MAPEG family protein [Gammaproteobacteria bacterium]
MIELILITSFLYFLHLLVPILVKSRMDEAMFERARRSLENLKESLPVFFVLAILSIFLDIEANIDIAFYWIIFRLIFAVLYISGFRRQPANEKGYEAQPLRSLVWMFSIVCLFTMGVNLI